MVVDLARGDTALVLAAAKGAGFSVPQIAYVLATACWETAGTFKPVREAFYLGAKADEYRARLRYAPWYGRGYVQLTWRDNYVRAGATLGVDLTSNPDRAMQPDIAASILVQGMKDGWFTGQAIGRYVNDRDKDYVQARRVINGTDCARQIATLAEAYEHALQPAASGVMRRGMRGADVARLQSVLVDCGHDVVVDGIFGQRTEMALRAVQRIAGLVADGIAGPVTWNFLYSKEEGK